MANSGDVEKIQSLVLALSYFYKQDKDTDLPEWFSATLCYQEFLNRVNSQEFTNYVYENETGIVGYISIKNNRHLYHLFVTEAFQGVGIARMLWNYVLSRLSSKTFSVRSSLYAIPIYERFGFVKVADVAEKDGIFFQAMEFRR